MCVCVCVCVCVRARIFARVCACMYLRGDEARGAGGGGKK